MPVFNLASVVSGTAGTATSRKLTKLAICESPCFFSRLAFLTNRHQAKTAPKVNVSTTTSTMIMIRSVPSVLPSLVLPVAVATGAGVDVEIGADVDTEIGAEVGEGIGRAVGSPGATVGVVVGSKTGAMDGAGIGTELGSVDGSADGDGDGCGDGGVEGRGDGGVVGVALGAGVGEKVSTDTESADASSMLERRRRSDCAADLIAFVNEPSETLRVSTEVT